jgi:hypothetical protein
MFDKLFKYGIVLTGMLKEQKKIGATNEIVATVSIRDRLDTSVEDARVTISAKGATWRDIQDMLGAFSRSTNTDGHPTSALGIVLGHFVVSVNPQTLDDCGEELGLPVDEFKKSKGLFKSSVLTKEWRHTFPAAESPTQKRGRVSARQEKPLVFGNA